MTKFEYTHTAGIYNVTAQHGLGDMGVIDIRPPVRLSKSYFGLCADSTGLELNHFATTPNVARYEAVIRESPDNPEGHPNRRAREEQWLKDTATFIANSLHTIDQGIDISSMGDDLF